MKRVRERVHRLIHFFSQELWEVQIARPTKTFRDSFILQLRILSHAVWGFHRDNCYLRASALTFYSLLSLMPVAAVAFGMAKGFGFRKLLETSLLEKFPGQEEVVHQVIVKADAFLESAKGGVIAGVGVVLLLWVVVKVLGHVEAAFNHIWQIRRSRPLSRKFSDYLSLMIICPLLFILSSSFAVYLTAEFRGITEKISLLGMVAPFVFSILDFSPYVIIWILFTFVYMFLPNTRVRFRSALLAGVTAGTAFQLVQYLYFHFQVGVAHYNAIYGSFAALPLFCIWMLISWLVVLSGAELSFSHQSAQANMLPPPSARLSAAQRRLIALGIVRLLIEDFKGGKPAPRATEIASRLGVALAFTETTLSMLCETRLISAVDLQNGEGPGYQPGQDISRLTIHRILEAVDNFGGSRLAFSSRPESRPFQMVLTSISDLIESAPVNRCLEDLDLKSIE
jgi:membrane protein